MEIQALNELVTCMLQSLVNIRHLWGAGCHHWALVLVLNEAVGSSVDLDFMELTWLNLFYPSLSKRTLWYEN